MKRLWAPWRASYITKIGIRQKSCIFCRILADNQDKKHLIFIREPHAYAVLNLYPYSNGHCLVVPNRHVGDISRLSRTEYVQLMDLLLKTKKILQKTFGPQGFNIGINLGHIAGAGIPGHVHIHVVPRWQGDHNFMPVVADCRVISQSLSAMYQKLIHADKTRH